MLWLSPLGLNGEEPRCRRLVRPRAFSGQVSPRTSVGHPSRSAAGCPLPSGDVLPGLCMRGVGSLAHSGFLPGQIIDALLWGAWWNRDSANTLAAPWAFLPLWDAGSVWSRRISSKLAELLQHEGMDLLKHKIVPSFLSFWRVRICNYFNKGSRVRWLITPVWLFIGTWPSGTLGGAMLI